MIEEKLLNKKINPENFLQEIKVFAPGTVANLSCGFDILGLAVYGPGDEVIMRQSNEIGVRIKSITGDDGKLPLNAEKNTVSFPVIQILKDLSLENEIGIEIELHKKMPIGSGLGSSSASTVAGVFAINELLGKPLSKDELLPYCLQGEELACGTAHADNVAPALYGGITLIKSYEPIAIRQLPVPKDLYVALIYPEVDVPTKEARKLIKDKVSLNNVIKQTGNLANLIASLYESDYEGIGNSIKDELIEPIRSLLIPSFDQMKEIALNEGALCFGISGSGPSVMALTTNENVANLIVEKIKNHLATNQVNSFTYVSKINQEGPYIIQ